MRRQAIAPAWPEWLPSLRVTHFDTHESACPVRCSSNYIALSDRLLGADRAQLLRGWLS